MDSYWYPLWSLLPILALLIISLWRGVKPAVYISLTITTLVYFLHGSGLPPFLASMVMALVDTINILLIIFGALLLYDVMSQKGNISRIKDSVSQIHPKKDVRFFFLALFLTAFFESVAGFGTPGAIVPLLLISLGYSPVLSIAAVLLIDGIFAISGAVGTPVIAGLESPLSLDPEQVSTIYLWAAVAIAAGGTVLMAFVYRYIKAESPPSSVGWQGWAMYLAVILPYAALASVLQELTGVISALVMAIFSYVVVFREKRISLIAWAPYGILVVLLLLPKIIPSLAEVLSYSISRSDLFGTGLEADIQPFRSPLVPFLIATGFTLVQAKDYQVTLRPVLTKTLAVFLILFPSLGITQLMLIGGEGHPSMVTALAGLFGQAGAGYPGLSPLIGVLGAFMTGSTTVSNIIFGPVQFQAATGLSYDPSIILSMQLAGASLGNAVCLFNIIAAATVAGIKDFQGILKKNLIPVLLASMAVASVGYLLIWVSQSG